MAVLEHLEPKRVFGFFEELCTIPHGSSNTKAASDWLVRFAETRGMECYQDSLNNVIIIKEATPGYEAAEPVILQGHMDMVCEQAPNCSKQMELEGLELAVEEDTVYAVGTTLGGDDGIAVAIMLALLDAEDLPHPRLEAVFTVDEEIGMLGAAGIDVTMLRGHRMLNLDSEEEGVFTVSCAGGNDTQSTLPLVREPWKGTYLTLTVGGLTGGHSGIEIHKRLGNSNILMGRLLRVLAEKTELRLVCVDGGRKGNVIPRETKAMVVTREPEVVRAVCRDYGMILRREYESIDPAVFVSVEETAAAEIPMDGKSTNHVIRFLTGLPDGVQTMSAEIQGLVETSLNLGILRTEEHQLVGVDCVRSGVDAQKRVLTERLRNFTESLGGAVEVYGEYSAWQYQRESPLRELLTEIFVEQYGYEPRIEALHAGVECGIFAEKLPGLDCVSIGPDLTEIHTCRERLHIASVQRLWKLVLETLRRMK